LAAFRLECTEFWLGFDNKTFNNIEV